MALVGGPESSSASSAAIAATPGSLMAEDPSSAVIEEKLARHLLERQRANTQFTNWCHDIGFECDSKAFQKVVADFFNRPWDGLQFAGPKQTELGGESAEMPESPGRKGPTSSKIPMQPQPQARRRGSVGPASPQSPPKRPRLEPNTLVKLELKAATVSWSATADRTIAIFQAPEIPREIVLEIPSVRGSVLDEHIESGLTEVDGLISQLKQFRLSIAGTAKITLTHGDKGGVTYKRGDTSQHLVSGFITSHLLIKRESNDSCFLWIATAQAQPDDDGAPQSSFDLDELRVGARVNAPVFVEISMVNLTTSEVIVDGLRCPGSSPIVGFACAEVDRFNHVALALASNGVAHLVRLSTTNEPAAEWELVGSLDVAATLVETPIPELYPPQLCLSAHRLSAGSIFVLMIATYPNSEKRWTQQAWTLLATPALYEFDLASSRVGSGGSFLDFQTNSQLTLPESDTLFIKQSQWDVSSTAHLVPLVVKDTLNVPPSDGLSSTDLSLLADIASSFCSKTSYLILSRMVVESVCLPFEASGGSLEESSQLKRMYNEDFLPAWAAQYIANFGSSPASIPSPMKSERGGRSLHDDISSPAVVSRRGRNMSSRMPRRLTNPLDTKSVRPMLQPELLKKMDTSLAELFFRLWLPVVTSSEDADTVGVCESLVKLVEEQCAGQATGAADRLATLARQAQTLVVEKRMLEVSREPGMEGIQAFLFLNTIEMLIQVSARLLKAG